MWYAWMPTLRFPLALDLYFQLPQNPAYKYEYVDGEIILSPNPHSYHVILDLKQENPAKGDDALGQEIDIRPLRPSDKRLVPGVFEAAFQSTQPFASMSGATRKKATQACVRHTLQGGDGPLVPPACQVAYWRATGAPLGAALITLVPGGDPARPASYLWPKKPPRFGPRSMGQPHLTWIFVAPFHNGMGVGTRLLQAAVVGLRSLGYPELWSTILRGNERSLLWHWGNGFRVAPAARCSPPSDHGPEKGAKRKPQRGDGQ